MSDYQGLVTKWQKVQDEMPEYDTDLLLWSEAWGHIYVGYWRHSEEWIGRHRPESDESLPDTNPTHWAYFPAPPLAEVIARNVQPSPESTLPMIKCPSCDGKKGCAAWGSSEWYKCTKCDGTGRIPDPVAILQKRVAELEAARVHEIEIWQEPTTRQIMVKSRDKFIQEIVEHLQREFADPNDPERELSQRWIHIGPGTLANVLAAHFLAYPEARPVQPAQIIAAQQAEDEGLWCIPQTVMEAHLQKELRRLTEAVEGKTSAECLRELLLKSRVQQPATEPDKDWCGPYTVSPATEKTDDAASIWYADGDQMAIVYGNLAYDIGPDEMAARIALALRDVPQGAMPDLCGCGKPEGDPAHTGWKDRNWRLLGHHKYKPSALAARQVPVGPEGKK